jgi:Protein of unknown function (DUF3168)
MSLESDLYTVLAAVCPRVYPDTAPDNPVLPYLVWQQIGGFVINPVADEVPNKQNAFIQVNAWATTRIEAKALAQQVEAALITSAALRGRPQSAAVATMDEEVSVRGTTQDFSIWAAR